MRAFPVENQEPQSLTTSFVNSHCLHLYLPFHKQGEWIFKWLPLAKLDCEVGETQKPSIWTLERKSLKPRPSLTWVSQPSEKNFLEDSAPWEGMKSVTKNLACTSVALRVKPVDHSHVRTELRPHVHAVFLKQLELKMYWGEWQLSLCGKRHPHVIVIMMSTQNVKWLEDYIEHKSH